ncbi:MAG: ABC transporter permease, partial [Prolixibacteraceae bacterium]|nr:ABC transporter permease [Prolixibacteraceae bacterium]
MSIIALSIGVASALFIYMFVIKEFKTDRFHKRSSEIYRVLRNIDGSGAKYSELDYPVGNWLNTNISEIENFTRYKETSFFQINVDDRSYFMQKITFVDRSFFDIFDFDVSIGDVNEIFNTPNKVFITAELAHKYFNSIDVVGKKIEVQLPEYNKKVYTVSGIIADYPEESTLKPQIIADVKEPEIFWELGGCQIFLHIPDSKYAKTIAPKISEVTANERKGLSDIDPIADPNEYELQKLTDLYLGSANVNDELPKGNKRLSTILLLMGFVLLSITFVNNIISNLGVALKDKKNFQIHKSLGCSNSWLKRKMISENILLSILAFSVSLFFYTIIHKIIVSVSIYQYSIISKSDYITLFSFLLVLILFGVISGLVLNLFVSSNINQKFQGIKFGTHKNIFGNLIQFQLVVFIATTISLFFIIKQLNLMLNMEMGFDTKNTYSLYFESSNDMKLFKQELEKYPFMKSISWGEQLYRKDFKSEEVLINESRNTIKSQIIIGDADYLKTYNIKLLQGKNFENGNIFEKEGFFNGPPIITVKDVYEKELWKKTNTNTLKEVLVNEEFVKKSGLKDPIGTILEIEHRKCQIVGVFNDVKNLPVYQSIKPIVIGYDINGKRNNLVVSIVKGAEKQFESIAREFYKERNFDGYFQLFVSHYDFEKEYHNEKVLSKLITVCTSITLCILVLGLFGLSLFITESKTKEIGIRKVNGAKTGEVMAMLNKDFIKWVTIAFIIATPISYHVMYKWLENFAYKTELSWWIFALAGLLALAIALLTVS